MADKIFCDGFNFKEPRDGAPDFVLGSISAKADKAIKFLQENANDRGYVNMDVLRGKSGEPYIALNTWKPEKTADGWKPKPKEETVDVSDDTDSEPPF